VNPYFVVLVVYSGVLIGLGLWLGKRVQHADDFFVAGRRLGPGLLFATVLAANIGAGTTVGAAGIGYAYGLSAWWWVGSAAIGTAVLAFWVGPKMRDLAAARGYLTVGDFIEDKYGAAARGTIAALLWVGTLAILAAQLLAGAEVLHAVVGMPKNVSCVLGGVVMTIYFAAGGLTGAAWINLLQLVVLLGGFAIAVPLVLVQLGGMSELVRQGAAVSVDYVRFWRGGGGNWVFYLALLAPNFMISPGLLQKVYGARDGRSVRMGLACAAVVLVVFALGPTVLGMAARLLHPVLASQQEALPTLLRDDLPVLVGALGLGALFMAEVSSADAILFMLATSLSKDLYKRFIDRRAGDARVLLVARIAAVGGGVGGVIFALVAESIVGSLKIFYSLVGVTLFVPVLAGLYRDTIGASQAFAAFGAGIGVTLLAMLWHPAPLLGFMTPNLLGLLAAAAAFVLAGIGRMLRTSDARAIPRGNS
jgi:solute:Na+ symporter, SSS family